MRYRGFTRHDIEKLNTLHFHLTAMKKTSPKQSDLIKKLESFFKENNTEWDLEFDGDEYDHILSAEEEFRKMIKQKEVKYAAPY